MMARLAQIRRHPVKGIAQEEIAATTLCPARPLPLDRAWAVLTGEAGDTGQWQPRRNFAQCAAAPRLMAVSARMSGARITFSHPERPEITIDPDNDGAQLIAWIAPLCPADRPAPTRLVRAPEQGMTDAPFASVSLMSLASLRAFSQEIGQPLDPRRFRGNLWLDGSAPWAEFDWIGRTLRIGTAELEVVERIERCRATEASPVTGQRDAPTLRVLQDAWGHRDFGVNARVVTGGRIAVNDPVEVL
ncbi:molybdenum cofactor biosysynthesis protein [Rhodovulum sp. NI22]|nr:molybdenum cofactor biosysynthesis protein [Rhodovulum sp. NI22]